MAELNKAQLTQENNDSFPNNNGGFITPTILRDFNKDMIDSLVDELSYNVESASFNARINALDPSGSAQAVIALEQATASLNAYTQSQNSFNSSATASIVALQNFSSSLDTTYATDAQLSASASTLQNNINTKLDSASFNAYTASFTVTGFVTTSSFNAYTQSAASGVSASINSATQSLSSSIATTTNNLDLEVNGKLDSSSFNSYTQSNDTKVNALIAQTGSYAISSSVANTFDAFSSSISLTYATETELSASASTLQNGINSKVENSTFNTYTQSQAAVNQGLTNAIATRLTTASFNSFTASALLTSSGWASTGSNTFKANQIISGNLDIDGNITALSASFTYLKTIYETSSVIFSSGSNQFGDELIDVQTLSGSVKIQGNLTVNGVPVQTSSFDASGYLLTSSFNTYTASDSVNTSASINAATQSLSSSLATGISASEASLSASLTLTDNSKLNTGSFNTYTSSVSTQIAALGTTKVNYNSPVNPQTITGSLIISGTSTNGGGETLRLLGGPNPATDLALHVLSGSVEITTPQGNGAHFYSNAPITSSNLRINGTAVIKDLFVSGTWGGSGSGSLFVENSITASTISASNIYADTVFASVFNGTSSFATQALSASYALTASFALNGGGGTTDTGSLLTTASFNTYTQSAASGVSASINAATQSLSSSIAVTTNNLDLEVNQKLDTGSFNTYTSSASTNVSESINSATQSLSSSIATTTAGLSSSIGQLSSITGSYATTGSNTFKASQIISGNLDVTGKITALSASITYLETIFETASVIYSSGSNQFGDASDDTQTLFGKVDVKTGPLVITGSTFVSGNITLAQGSDLVTHHIKAAAVNGVEIQNNSGNTAILVGAGGSLGTTFYGQINATSISASGNITGNLLGTASYANKALTASFAENVTPIDSSSFATTGSNIFIGTQTITGSVILSSSADIELTVIGNTIISGNLLVTGSNINLEVDPPALSIGVTNVKTIADATASGVVSSEDIYRTGAGPTGDLSGIRLQTLSGSDTTGDTLLSRISTGVNRHTSTAMTGSVVNTIINSTWATGSGGARVSYASNVIANAQSASSTLTLNAGNASANYGGGTASLLAGRVNIGTTNATITSTGSFTHLGSFVTSQGITSNNGGITATSGSINGEFRVNGSINITGSNPTIQSGSLSGSLISNLGDIYTGSNNANYIVTLGSASMASLLAGSSTDPNTLYFVLS